MTIFLKSIFHIAILFLVIVSIYPGSIIGYLFYGDWGLQPTIIENPFGTTINHFFAYLFLSLIGFTNYLKRSKEKKLFYILIVLATILELVHFVIPNRSFQIGDIIGNILGVIVAYFLVRFYLHFIKYE